jgi:hypothetical protein
MRRNLQVLPHAGGKIMNRERALTAPSLKWLQILFLGVALAAGVQQARAQMTGNFSGDMSIINSALAATVGATSKADPEASRLSMEELYRQWRMFRARNFEAQAANPSFMPSMEKVEASLFTASKLVDSTQWAEANSELQNAQKLLQAVRPVAVAKPKVDEPENAADKRY